MAFLLAIASSVLYGTADFMGGIAARRTSAVPIVLISQAAGLLLVVALLPVFPHASPTTADLVWGAAAGVAGGTGVALLYHALAIGTMSVVAPTTAVCAVAIPVLASLALGERPELLAIVGIVVGIAAIAFVSLQTPAEPVAGSRPKSSGVGVALASGVAVGIFLFALAQAQRGAGLWPLVASRGVSTVLIGTLAFARRTSLRMPRGLIGLTVVCGIVDMMANALYMVAAQIGPLSLVVTLSSLYPASTVILASVVLHERLNVLQKLGVALALVAVVLIVRG
ncbi:MAG TPA: EamA family transporter [Gemmatimonadaceae bacterium]|nr:EamA family transporter [Gemmatimonadaceae bacterium]